MAIRVMLTVLAVAISATTTRPTTMNTSTERAQRDELGARLRARDNEQVDYHITNSGTAAATGNKNTSHCPRHALYTFPHVRRLPRRGHSGLHSLSLRRKPSGSQGPAPMMTTLIRGTTQQTQLAVMVTETRASGNGPVDPDRSPQVPDPESAPSGRTGAAPAPTRPPCPMLCRRGQSEERAPEKSWEAKLKRDTGNKKTYPDSKKICEPPETERKIYLTIKKEEEK